MDTKPELQAGMLPWNTGTLAHTFFGETTQDFFERGQSAARNLMDLNAELVGFMNQRATRNRDALVRLVQCRDLPDVMNAESSWLQLAFDDYARETSRLLQYNARLVTCMIPAARDSGTAAPPAASPDRPAAATPPGTFVPA